MKSDGALRIFGALAQETRLEVLRILVKHGKQGLAAGALGEKLGIPHNTLSFHLSHLAEAGLITSQKQGRSMVYFVNLDTMHALVCFLLKDYCGVNKSICKNIEELIRAWT